jgi:hypothetical protein
MYNCKKDQDSSNKVEENILVKNKSFLEGIYRAYSGYSRRLEMLAKINRDKHRGIVVSTSVSKIGNNIEFYIERFEYGKLMYTSNYVVGKDEK